ncbi:cyclic lactone autoinducer peptide [Desulfuribacillus stibiiarsenatis]|nr:cyclic lactone autoinducer peptide [Desulfuribacillus stibiiarsenatis]
MMSLKVKFYSIAASVLAVVAATDFSIASFGSFYQPEIPEELK